MVVLGAALAGKAQSLNGAADIGGLQKLVRVDEV